MPDDPTGQAPTDPAPTPPADPAPPADPPADPAADPDPADPPAAAGESDEVKKLRQEAAARRRDLRDAQAELKKFQDAQLSETEKLQKRATDAEARSQSLEQRAKDALLRAEITAAAAKAGVTDVNDATLLLPSVGQVEWDDDTGEPTNIADLVTKLVEAKPYLVGQQDDPPARDPRTQKTAPATPRRSGGRFTEAQVNAMTPQQIAALSDEDFAAAQAVFSK